MSTPGAENERPPLHLPGRPSKRRRDLRNRLVHADKRAHAPARPERGAHEYATVDGARKRLSFRGLARIGSIAPAGWPSQDQ